MPINIPPNDAHFAPGSELRFARSSFVRGLGGLREFQNLNTGYLDLSNLYGSTRELSDGIRTGYGGLLIARFQGGAGSHVREDLPFNHELRFPLDIQGESFGVRDLRACGEKRCNENVPLQALTTLFMRNHNRLAYQVQKEFPNFSDEDIFQIARLRNIMQYQYIIYNEWLPVLLGDDALKPMDDEAESREAGTNLMFSTCAFRMGHSGVPDTIQFYSSREARLFDISLGSAFFAPSILNQPIRTDQVLAGMLVQEHEALDTAVVEDLRCEFVCFFVFSVFSLVVKVI